MTHAANLIAMASQTLPNVAEGGDAPEWIHVLPAANGSLKTVDGRGPYFVRNAQAVIDASMSATSDGTVPVDQDHSTLFAAPKGFPAPARGWITEMQARDDGIWAKVNWTKEGRELVSSQAYRKISPVLRHKANGDIIAIREVSLVNRPNLQGLISINQEGSDMLHQKLIELLGLGEDATEDQVLAAMAAAMEKPKEAAQSEEGAATVQAQLDIVAAAVGLEAGSSVEDIVTAAQATQEGASEVSAMQAQIKELTGGRAKDKAEAFVDGAIRDFRVGVKPQRDEFISMHMANPAQAEKIIGALPCLEPSGTTINPPSLDGEVSEMSAQELGAKAAAYVAKCATEGRVVTAAMAVDAVLEGQA